MKLSLLAAIAFPLAAAAASSEEAISWGTSKIFPSSSDITVGDVESGDKPAYCSTAPPNPTCYRDSYAACCTNGSTCPETRPPCECNGDCTEEVRCEFPNDSCGKGNYCHIGEGKCRLRSATVSGVCIDTPNMCTADFQPVCGCDGETYSNACGAAAAGVNVEQKGACNTRKPDRTPCTFPDGDECGDKEYCKIPDGDCRKRIATQQGVCVSTPNKCTSDYNPVCGCDGKTYSNACQAESAGANVMKEGACDTRRGSNYCTWSPDDSCYKQGKPQCCLDDDQQCPSEQPRCDKGQPGWDYCAWGMDKKCYPSSDGRPPCCARFGGTNCPKTKPNCEVPEEVKFLRSN